MKIFYLLEYPLEIHGGAQLSTLSTAKELNKIYNIDTFIITPGYKKIPHSYDAYGVTVLKLKSCYYTFPNPIKNPIRFLKVKQEMERLITAYNPDIIHSQMPLSFIYNALIDNKVFKIHTDRGLYSGYSKKSKLMYKILMYRIDKLITTTFFNYKLWPISIEKKLCIYNTVSNYFENFDDTKNKLLRKKYEIEMDMITIGFSGRFTYFKNWPFVFQLIDRLVNNNVNFHLFISFAINGNNSQEIEDFQKFKDKIYQKKTKNLTIFQNLNQEEMSNFYYPIDIFIIPSIFESFGKVAVEAMSRKCCIVSSDVGGLPEVVGDSLLVVELDINKFYEKILYLIHDRKKLKVLQEQFFNRYVNVFTSNKNTLNHFELYTKCLKISDKYKW